MLLFLFFFAFSFSKGSLISLTQPDFLKVAVLGSFLIGSTDHFSDVSKVDVAAISEVVNCNSRVEVQMVFFGPNCICLENFIFLIVA